MLRVAKSDNTRAKALFTFLESLYENHGVEAPADVFLGMDAIIRVNSRVLLSMMTPGEIDEVLEGRLLEAPLIRRLITGELKASAYSADLHARLLTATGRLADELEPFLRASPSPSYELEEVRESLLDLLRVDAARAVELASQMVQSGVWRSDDVASLYVTESAGSVTRRIGFNLTALKRHWGEGFALVLASASTLGYPREWDLNGHPQDLTVPVDPVLARGLASYGLTKDSDLGGDPFDHFE